MGSVDRHLRGKKYSNFSEYNDLLIETSDQIVHIHNSTENYETKDYQDQEQLSDNSTNDSGVITLKDETIQKSPIKKLSFSPECDRIIEVEVETYQPKYYDITPQKYIAHLKEAPKLQKVQYAILNNSIPEKKNEELTKEVLQKANLIKNQHCEPELLLDLSPRENTFVRSPSCRSVDDKFVVNLFESRQSKRWKRRGVCLPNSDTIQPITEAGPQLSEPDSHITSYSEPWREEELPDDNEMFHKLKKERDMECVKMVQASNVLKVIRKNPNRDWSDELLAEKILLETDERYGLLINKIRDLGYAEVVTPKPSHTATVTVSNFEFLLKPEECKQTKYSDFFIVTLSHGTELLMSKVTSPMDDKILFDEQFTFANLKSDFNIIVKIFTIRLKTNGKTTCSFFSKRTKNFCPMSKIYYENVNTYEMKESAVLKPSFRCCGEFSLTKNNIGSSNFILSQVPGDLRLQPDVNYSFHVNSLQINSKVSGFLTLGLPNKQNDVLFWERKWCVLNGTKLSIYNYPSEEAFGESTCCIDLKYCLVSLSTHIEGCPRKRTFLLKTGRPGVVHDENNVALRKKSNFVLEKYVFATDNNSDFELWTDEIQSILNCLQDWQELVFLDDYY